MPGVTKDSAAMRIDYLKSVLKPLSWYSVNLRKASVDEAVCPTEVVDRQYFQIVQVVTSQSRPHLMPTIKSRDETMMRARLALNIQSVAVKPGVEDPAGGLVLFEDSDSEWRSWAELGPWQDVHSSLQVFRRVEGSHEHLGCIVAYDPEAARPPYAVTDFRCPAITMVAELHRRGWRPTKARVFHEFANVGVMDSREATKMKAYYIALLEIHRCFPLAIHGLPSDQPILYYKLLLRGQRVEYGLGAKAYLAIMNGLPKPEQPPPILDDSSDEDVIHKSLIFLILRFLSSSWKEFQRRLNMCLSLFFFDVHTHKSIIVELHV